MLFSRINRGRAIVIAASVVMLAVTFIMTGCGTDQEEFSEDKATLRVKEEQVKEKEVISPEPSGSIADAGTGNEPESTTVEEIGREVSYGEAEDAYFAGDFPEAVELFERYTERKSGNPWGYYMLGLSAWKLQDYQKAEDSFQRALELDPGHVKSRLNLSRVYLDIDRAEEAVDQIAAVLEADPESAAAYHLMGRAYRQMDETGKAVDSYRKAIRIDNDHVWSMNNLGLIYIREGRFEEALPPLARAAVIRDDIAVFQNNLGMALENTGHYREAENAYAAAVTMDKSYDRAYNNLCRVELLEEGPVSESIDLAAIAESYIIRINSSEQSEVAGPVLPQPADSLAVETASAVVEEFIRIAGVDTAGAD